jgi:hypothetical protein
MKNADRFIAVEVGKPERLIPGEEPTSNSPAAHTERSNFAT